MKLLLNTLITLAALCAAIPSYTMDTAEDSAEQDKSSEVTIVDSQKQRDYLVFCTACFKKVCTSNALHYFNLNANHKCDPSKFDFDPDTYERCTLLNEYGEQCRHILHKSKQGFDRRHTRNYHSSSYGNSSGLRAKNITKKQGKKRKESPSSLSEDGTEHSKKRKSKGSTLVSCRNCTRKLCLSSQTPLQNQYYYHKAHAAECTNPVFVFTAVATARFNRCPSCPGLIDKIGSRGERNKHKCFLYPIPKNTTSTRVPPSLTGLAVPIPAAAPSSHDASSYAQPAAEPATIAASSSAASIDLPAPAAAADSSASISPGDLMLAFPDEPESEPKSTMGSTAPEMQLFHEPGLRALSELGMASTAHEYEDL